MHLQVDWEVKSLHVAVQEDQSEDRESVHRGLVFDPRKV